MATNDDKTVVILTFTKHGAIKVKMPTTRNLNIPMIEQATRAMIKEFFTLVERNTADVRKQRVEQLKERREKRKDPLITELEAIDSKFESLFSEYKTLNDEVT